MEAMIVVTTEAAESIKEMMAEQNEQNAYLRFSVHGGGCSGLSYGMNFDQNKSDDDIEIVQHDIRFLVAKDVSVMVKGTTIGYKRQALGGGFTIDNPNAIATCGCGSSFRTKSETGAPEQC